MRVLDLTRVLAGPFCSMILGDMGAEVIKIEEPGKGDDTRSWPPFVGGEATYFLAVNRNKQSVTLNLKAPEGRELLKRLVKKSDVVLENFRTGTMERLGLGYATLKKLNPRLVYCATGGVDGLRARLGTRATVVDAGDPPDLRLVLRDLAGRYRWVLVAPRPSMPTALAATAWHRRLLCPDGAQGPIGTFVTAFRNQGPEKGFV